MLNNLRGHYRRNRQTVWAGVILVILVIAVIQVVNWSAERRNASLAYVELGTRRCFCTYRNSGR